MTETYMRMTETDLIARLTRYTLCFNDRCPKGENCLRRMLARHNVPECKRISVVNPLCYPPEGEACEFFRSDRKLQIAWGFSKLYNDMPARIATAIHAELEGGFNHTTYYRYRNQKKGLTPAQQQYIRQVCLRHGWKEEPVFDRYTEEYDW